MTDNQLLMQEASFLPSNNMLIIYCEGFTECVMQTVYQTDGLHSQTFYSFSCWNFFMNAANFSQSSRETAL